MKTSELRKWLDENEWEYVEKGDYILIGGIKIYKKYGVLDIPNLNFGRGSDTSMLLQKVLEYLETPISEREDEKKYRIIIDNTISEGIDFLTLRVNKNAYYFSVFDTNTIGYQRTFTQQEIDNFPAEIKGAIECGFLRKAEVE